MATQPSSKTEFALVSEKVVFIRRFERVRREQLFAQISAFMQTKRTGRVTIDISQGGISLLELCEAQVTLKNT